MSADDYIPARPLSVAIPKLAGATGPYCPRRPNLNEILSNASPPPWTLTAFMAYLSHNHCLETLEFTMDAGRYKKHYAKMLTKVDDSGLPPTKDREYVQLLWNRLIDAYIRPNGSREVNLPSEVRDPILSITYGRLPPAPEALDLAVSKIYELMEESVLVPFLNSTYPQTAPVASSIPYAVSQESVSSSEHHGRSRHARSSPPPHVKDPSYSASAPSAANRKSAPSNLTTALKHGRFSIKLSPTMSHAAPSGFFSTSSAAARTSQSNLHHTVSGSTSNGPGMTDDSGSQDSPTNESPMTPPTSPPMSDVGSVASPNQSPRQSRDSGVWKKFSRLSGMKVHRKKSQAGMKNEES